jgi:hypothetical protein
MMADDRGTRPRQEGVRGLNGWKDNEAEAKTKEINDGPVAGLSGVDDIGSHAKPDQYGRGMCGLGHSSARTSSCEAFLAECCKRCERGSRQENASNQNPVPVRFHRTEKDLVRQRSRCPGFSLLPIPKRHHIK